MSHPIYPPNRLTKFNKLTNFRSRLFNALNAMFEPDDDDLTLLSIRCRPRESTGPCQRTPRPIRFISVFIRVHPWPLFRFCSFDAPAKGTFFRKIPISTVILNRDRITRNTPIMRRLATVLGVEIDLPSASRQLAGYPDRENDARDRTVALFQDLREPLGRYLASLGVRQPEIEEIVQEAFLRLHRHLSNGQGRAGSASQNLGGWVFRVAQNLVRDRQRGWHGRHVDSIEDRPEAALASAPGATPEERVLHLEKVRLLRAGLEALPDQHRRWKPASPGGRTALPRNRRRARRKCNHRRGSDPRLPRAIRKGA